jgi:hypothetical protein
MAPSKSNATMARFVVALAILVPFTLSGSSPPSFAQYPNIRVSEPGSTDPEEVTISINPTNPLNLAAGANIDYCYYSLDGGLTWVEDHMTSSLGVWGDPCVLFDDAGNLYYSHLANPASGYWLDRIVVQKSTDGGATWSDGASVGLNTIPHAQDKEWMATDSTGSPYQDNLYVCWTEFDYLGSSAPEDSSRILCSYSTDYGETWSPTVQVCDVQGRCLDGDETVEGAVPAVGPLGEVYTAWAGPLGIMFDRSTDGGVTFGEDVFVSDQPGGWAFEVPGIYRCNGLPVTACDISNSPYRGHIYVLWSDQRHGLDDTDVFLIKSTDGGNTWVDRVRVNDDATTRHQFFCWMTVDPMTGIIYVTFYDRRNTTGNDTEVYVARSEDGGATFENFCVSETPFTPTASVFFGDYTNIAARDGMIYPIWMRMDGTALSVWIALIEEGQVGIGPLASNASGFGLELLPNHPNPFNPSTTLSFDVDRERPVNVAVFDIAGRQVAVLADRHYGPGRHSLEWDGRNMAGRDVASGTYLVRMITGDQRQTRKITLIR